ncbi:MAG: hypothetical protein R2880_03385 [Deinococcales bacterium]
MNEDLSHLSSKSLAEQLHKSEKAIYEGRALLRDYNNFLLARLEVQRRLWQEAEFDLGDILKRFRDSQLSKMQSR